MFLLKMSELFSIEAEVTFIPKAEGGRLTIPTLSGCAYRPHLVVGDPNQRQAIVIGNEIQETYLAIAFQSSSEDVEFNKPFLAELVLMNYPHPIYDSLVPNATFTVREGAQIVGFGQVRSLPNQKTAI
jgi:hypothetical protein